MRKHTILGIIVFCATVLPSFTNAAFTTTQNTTPFGGRVLTTKVPSVTCAPPGTGPVVLIGNLVSLGGAVYSGASNQQTTFQRVGGVASGVYNAIPYYTTDATKVPRAGQWILGRANMIPDMKTCYSEALGGFPVPVKKTTNYGVSGQSWKK